MAFFTVAPIAPVTRYPESRPRPPAVTPPTGTPPYYYVNPDGSWDVWTTIPQGFRATWGWRHVDPYEAIDGHEVTVEGFTFHFYAPHQALGLGGAGKRGWDLTEESQARVDGEIETLIASGNPIYVPMPTLREFIHSDNQHAQIPEGPIGEANEDWFKEYILAAYRAQVDQRQLERTGNDNVWVDPINETSYQGDPNFDLLEWPGEGDLDNIERIYGCAGYRHYWLLFVDPSKETIVLLKVPFVHHSSWRTHVRDVGRNPWLHKIGLVALQFIPVVGQVAATVIVSSGVFKRQELRAAQLKARDDHALSNEIEATTEALLTHEAQIANPVVPPEAQSTTLPGLPKTTATVLLAGGAVLGTLVLLIGLFLVFKGR